ncbi:MAG: hypothetical protein LPJ91_01415 [Pseudazoarcus pumilus]|nr:hypothetical protein [Pseudazoarcus pumilus]
MADKAYDWPSLLKRTLAALLISLPLAAVWFYLYLAIGLHGSRMGLPRWLWFVLSGGTPWVLGLATLAWACKRKRIALAAYGLVLLVLGTSFALAVVAS